MAQFNSIGMQKFLVQVIDELLKDTSNFQQQIWVIPGHRPKAFLRKYLIQKNYSGIVPQMITIEQLLSEISGLQLITDLELWFETYAAYRKTLTEHESFDEFLKWAPTLLKDFDDIDAALIEEQKLFELLVSEERIKQWGKMIDIGSSELISNHIGFWVNAQKIYQQLKADLLAKQQAYRGLNARVAAQKVDEFTTENHYVFIGFNALTAAEEKIMKTLVLNEKAETFWDADDYYLEDNQQEAGVFLRKYKAMFPQELRWSHQEFSKPKKIKYVQIPKQVAQAQYVGEELAKLRETERDNTAVVLADETLLPAVLNALPAQLKKTNVTMGMPLKSIPMANFFKEVFALFQNKEKFKQSQAFYFKNVQKILNNSYFGHYFLPEKTKLNLGIVQQNMIFVSIKHIKESLGDNPFSSLFQNAETPEVFVNHLIEWVNVFYEKAALNDWDAEYLFRFRSLFVQLKNLMEAYPWIENFKLLYSLYLQLLQSEKISFVGEPLAGLQILGVLETRLLDFENIILCSANEGVIPQGRKENSLIPFDFRTHYALPTFLENDAIFAYHFYRMFQRSSSATFLYNTDSDGLGNGEMSRFLQQLDWESSHEIEKVVAGPEFSKSEASTQFNIEKTPIVLEKLDQWKERISPSSLATYLRDPIRFYERYILKIREEDEVEESAGQQTLGNAVHKILEEIYTPYLNEILKPNTFKKINQEKTKIISEVFESELLKGNKAVGKNVLIMKIAEEMVNNVLKKDQIFSSKNELIVTGLEEKISASYKLEDGEEIQFSGYIDRIEKRNGEFWILDYKTGKFDARDLKLKAEKYPQILENYKLEKPIQLSLYAYMFLKQKNEKEVLSGIYPLRYFGKEVHPLSLDNETILRQENLLEVMSHIGDLVAHILNPEVPFSEELG